VGYATGASGTRATAARSGTPATPPAASQSPALAAPSPAAPEPASRQRNIGRLRRIEGQLRGLQRMLEKDRPCSEVLTQMASVHEALRAVARELLRGYLKQRAAASLRGGATEGDALGKELVDLIQKYSR
jgi:CsoR family transcriptional regulator, copper-sensing transcriptional repressor